MKIICGIDEAGRGALAGPLVAAAVSLTQEVEQKIKQANLKIKDGKLLRPFVRRQIYSQIIKLGALVNTEIISTRKINNRGIARANRESIRSLIKRNEASIYIVDGKLKLGRIAGKTHNIKCIVDADATILPAILAGIVAKVERDKLMQQLHQKFPKYKWINNVGYGTRKHLEAIQKYGTTHHHRSIFVTSALRNLSISMSGR
jgi:ribonuclease HII